MHELHKGYLITVEGIDGSGKSTLAQTCFQELQKMGYPVLFTKEPGATPLGKHLRSLVQEKQVPITPVAEYLLFAADRAQHFAQVVMPALEKKIIIISDRMADSSLAYQGYGRGLNKDYIQQVNQWCMNNIVPDLTLYVRIPLATAIERIKARNQALTSFEKEKQDFTQRVMDGFENIMKDRSNGIILDGLESPEQLAADGLHAIMALLEKGNRL
jgi:dTMP kinase